MLLPKTPALPSSRLKIEQLNERLESEFLGMTVTPHSAGQPGCDAGRIRCSKKIQKPTVTVPCPLPGYSQSLASKIFVPALVALWLSCFCALMIRAAVKIDCPRHAPKSITRDRKSTR